MLVHRLRRWHNIKPILSDYFMPAELPLREVAYIVPLELEGAKLPL